MIEAMDVSSRAPKTAAEMEAHALRHLSSLQQGHLAQTGTHPTQMTMQRPTVEMPSISQPHSQYVESGWYATSFPCPGMSGSSTS